MQGLFYNPAQSRVYLLYETKYGRWQDEGTIAEKWASGSNVIGGSQREIAVLAPNAVTPSASQCMRSVLFIRQQSGDSPLPVVPPRTVIQVPPIKVVNKDFKRRKARGEVIMSPYRIGTVEYQRTLVVKAPVPRPWPTSVNQQVGWMAVKPGAIGPWGVWPSLPPTPSGMKLLEAGVMVRWSWMSMPSDDVILSPDVSAIDFTPTFDYDPGIVTAAVADCNNGVYDILTEALELPSTFSFLSDEFKKIVGVTADTEEQARAMRRKLHPAAFAKWLSGHWLKYRYAVMPLFYSVSDITSVLKQIGREYAAFRESVVKTDLPFAPSPGLRYDNSVTCTHRCMIKTRYTTDSLIENLSRLLNANLASSAWELTPYSFVYDWAINIGDYIAATTGTSGATEQCCSYSIRYFGDLKVSYDSSDPRLAGVSTLVKVNLYDRTVINPSDHIGLQFELDLTWKRIVDAFALATNPSIRRLRAIRN